MHNDFTLFKRTYPNGKKVIFYLAYDEEGKRVGPWTTHCLTKTAARNYCHKLLREGNLIPNKKTIVTFGDYAKGFWERGSEYVERQESRSDMTDDYLTQCSKYVTNQIMPFFADTPLTKLTENDINEWLLGFKNRKVIKDGKEEIVHYKNTYANTILQALSVMLNDAVRRGLIDTNPCAKVKRLKNDRRNLEIFSLEEVQKMFPKDYKTIWGDMILPYATNRLASLTGMRIGEILGLRGEFIFDDYIYVCGQYGVKGYKPYTKTKQNRNIPLLPDMIDLLKKLMTKNGKGFVFSSDGGATPVSPRTVKRGFDFALGKIGIDKNEMKRRGLSLHGWRHFLNTELQRQGLSIEQVKSVTGHKTNRMSEWYSHLDARQIGDVVKAQKAIYGNKPETKKGNKKAKDSNIIEMPSQKTA